MDRSSFRTMYNVCFYLISFIIKIPQIVESRECPSVRTAISAHVPVFEFGDPVSAQRPCYLPSAKNFYKHYIYVILLTRSFH